MDIHRNKGEADKDGRRGAVRAAALGFNPGTDQAPRVLARGTGRFARDIVNTARAAGKPIIRDPDFSAMLEALPVGREIPENLHRAAAAVFAMIYGLNRERARAGRVEQST